jgi:hypothetical protein
MALAATSLFGVSGDCAPANEAEAMQCKRGVILEVSTEGNTFRLGKHSGKPVGDFIWDTGTRFVENGHLVSARKLQPRDRATVRYASREGRLIAREITLREAQPADPEPGGQARANITAPARSLEDDRPTPA